MTDRPATETVPASGVAPAAAATAAPSSGLAQRTSLIDSPIQRVDQDSLSLSRYASALAEFIDTCDTPVTIGIQGDWGIGKTSLLRMLEELLQPRRGRRFQTPTLYINTWQYAQFKQEEFLPIAILMGIVKQLEARFAEKAKDEIQQMQRIGLKLAKFVGAVANSAIESTTGVSVAAGVNAAKDATDSPLGGPDVAEILQVYRQRFATLVQKIVPGGRDKLVIMIDDLDRVRPVRALEMLEAIKNFADVPGCVFVLAVDYGVIQQGVADRLGKEAQQTHGKSYFDKIIQVPFNMPVSAYQLDNYIINLLGWKFDGDRATLMEEAFLPAPNKDSHEHRYFFDTMTRMSVGSNPRAIKRVVNYVKLLRLVRDEGARAAVSGLGKGQSDRRWDVQSAKILYALACMQIEWPEVFGYFARNPSPGTLKKFESWEAIHELNDLKTVWKRYPDPDQAKTNLLGFFDELIAVVDEDGNGEVGVEEFRVIWQILRDAQLTNVDLPNHDEVWRPLDELLVPAPAAGSPSAKFVEAIRSSQWSNPMHLRTKRAGRRFVNLIWEDDSLGSMVISKRTPLTMYVSVKEPMVFLARHKDMMLHLEAAEGGHFGVGNIEVAVDRIGALPAEKQQDFLNRLLAAVLADAKQ